MRDPPTGASAPAPQAPFERPAFWDERYGADAELVDGREPNASLAEVLEALPVCRLLLVADGEGRSRAGRRS